MAHHDPNQPLPLGAPIDRSQETYEPSPYEARVVPPSGDVSPDGSRPYPSPSLTAKVVTYGGAAVAAAALTAGSVLAVRKIVDMVSGDDRLHRRAEDAAERARARVYSGADDASRDPAPRFDRLDDTAREAVRSRVRAREAADDAARANIRARARRAPRMSLMDEAEHTANRLNGGILGFVNSIGAAVSGFRTVASQAEEIMREFHAAADSIRDFLKENAERQPRNAGRGRSFRADATDSATDAERRAEALDERRRHTL